MPPPNRRLRRLATWLVASTLTYNVIEAVIALWSGAEAESIALFGFGLDSVVEFAAAGVVLWRLAVEARGADAATVATTERWVRRFVGATFLLLALYVTAQAGVTLWRQQAPEASTIGIALDRVTCGHAAARLGQDACGTPTRKCSAACGGEGDAGLLVSLRRPACGTGRKRCCGLVVG